MTRVNIHEAKTHLSALIARAEAGEEIVVARAGRPVVRLTPVESIEAVARRTFGTMSLVVPDDFDAPLDEQELVAWE